MTGRRHSDTENLTYSRGCGRKRPIWSAFRKCCRTCWTGCAAVSTATRCWGTGAARTGGDESCPIAFRSDRFELQYFDQQWLSDRPFVPGSRFADQSGCPRVFAVCALRDRAKGGAGRFRFVNTHLDHEREYARAEGTRHIIAELARLGAQTALPYVITGDFNAEPGSEPLTIMAASGLRDLSAESGVTFHGYGRAKNRSKIDYIMAPAPVESRGTRVWSETRGGLFLSDHYPVETTLTGWGK